MVKVTKGELRQVGGKGPTKGELRQSVVLKGETSRC